MAQKFGDPYWMTTRYASKRGCARCGEAIPIGSQVFYYPGAGSMYFGACAEDHARDFTAHAADDAFVGVA